MRAFARGCVDLLIAHGVGLTVLVSCGFVGRRAEAQRLWFADSARRLYEWGDWVAEAWLEMLPPWWRGWACGMAFAACLVETAAFFERAAPRRQTALGTRPAAAPWSRAGRGGGTPGDPRVARDDAWAAVLRDACEADTRMASHLQAVQHSRARVEDVEYACNGAQLFGTLFVAPELANSQRRLPGVVLLHTAAGPRDLFLYWKAEVLAARGCCVLVADLYGDEVGGAWEDAQPFRAKLDAPHVLRDRVRAAFDVLRAQSSVDAARLAALGWCLGGRAAVNAACDEKIDGLIAVVAFHGTLRLEDLDGVADLAAAPATLVCHGADDPFIPDFELFNDAMRAKGADYDVHVFSQAAHGFTNPAQAFNGKTGFAYNDRAAHRAWVLAEHHLSDAFAARADDA
ncbi:Alpha/Beta hydrolase protein [Pelagophyceae sp. CCMP2097]|nr:Alpha/Beta hydrolase protein [Pelagophyceae sp. CCMP2097]